MELSDFTKGRVVNIIIILDSMIENEDLWWSYRGRKLDVELIREIMRASLDDNNTSDTKCDEPRTRDLIEDYKTFCEQHHYCVDCELRNCFLDVVDENEWTASTCARLALVDHTKLTKEFLSEWVLSHKSDFYKLTLDDAIEHALEKSEKNYGMCAENHKQLAEWLEELKKLKDYGVLFDKNGGRIEVNGE